MQRLYISAVLCLDIEGYLLLLYKRETSDSRRNSRYEIKVRLENFKTSAKYELDFCAVRFFASLKIYPWKDLYFIPFISFQVEITIFLY